VSSERSLIVLKNYLGDTVMASPLVRAVQAQSSVADILGPPISEQILRFPGRKSRFYDPGNLAKIGQLLRTAKLVKQGQYNTALVVNRSFRSALVVRLAGIPRRVGHSTEGRGFLLTHRVAYHMDRNEALSYLDLLPAADQEEPDEFDRKPVLWVSDDERTQGAALLNGATIGIQPGARHHYKQIPIGIWQAIGRELERRGHRIAFFGGVEERGVLGELQFHGEDLVGRTSLRETIGALANLQLMIGGDTGVMHLAAAVGTPTITAFGPTPSKKWGWFNEPHTVIQAKNQDLENLEFSEFEVALSRVP